MHIATIAYLEQCGYKQYIVDWFCRNIKFYHKYQFHNWQATDEVALLGIGVSAYSYIDGIQYYNVNVRQEYCSRLESGAKTIWKGEILAGEEEKVRSALMLGLKCGVRRLDFMQRFGVEIVDLFPSEFAMLEQLELIEIGPEVIRLTNTGTLFADEVGKIFYSASIRSRMGEIKPTLISTTHPKVNPMTPRSR